MKRALGDKFLLVSISVLVLASILFGYFVFQDSGIGPAFGLPLTERQKERATGIAMSDPIVMNEVLSLASRANDTYYVRGVLEPRPFHELGPDLDRNRSLPVVEIVVGNENEKGTNVLAYVDLGQARVVNIGFPKHADAYADMPHVDDRPDMSIAETGYHAGEILTGEQRDKVVRIARENKDVQEKMRGKNYSVDGDVMVSYVSFYKDDNLYVGAYPMVRFTEGTSMYEPDFLVDVVVDADRGEVLNSWVLVRTPVLRS